MPEPCEPEAEALAAAGNATALLLDGPKGRVAVRLAEDGLCYADSLF